MLRTVMSPPWCLRVVDEAPLTLLAIARGEAWVSPDGDQPVRLGPGDVAVARGPDHYTIADPADAAPSVYIHPGQDCRSPTGESMAEAMTLGVRTWGNDPNGPTVMLVGAYESLGDVSDRLLRALPPLLTLERAAWDSTLATMLCDEAMREEPGQSAVLDRLLDLVLISALRAWFSRPEAEPPAWFRAHADPVVGRALRLMHGNPSHPWTLARLAVEVGASRSALARRFHDRVGEPPMTFLTEWRLALAADLLCEPDATVTSVASKVGYGSPFALSTAFKRVRGISPREHRARAMSSA